MSSMGKTTASSGHLEKKLDATTVAVVPRHVSSTFHIDTSTVTVASLINEDLISQILMALANTTFQALNNINLAKFDPIMASYISEVIGPIHTILAAFGGPFAEVARKIRTKIEPFYNLSLKQATPIAFGLCTASALLLNLAMKSTLNGLSAGASILLFIPFFTALNSIAGAYMTSENMHRTNAALTLFKDIGASITGALIAFLSHSAQNSSAFIGYAASQLTFPVIAFITFATHVHHKILASEGTRDKVLTSPEISRLTQNNTVYLSTALLSGLLRIAVPFSQKGNPHVAHALNILRFISFLPYPIYKAMAAPLGRAINQKHGSLDKAKRKSAYVVHTMRMLLATSTIIALELIFKTQLTGLIAGHTDDPSHDGRELANQYLPIAICTSATSAFAALASNYNLRIHGRYKLNLATSNLPLALALGVYALSFLGEGMSGDTFALLVTLAPLVSNLAQVGVALIMPEEPPHRHTEQTLNSVINGDSDEEHAIPTPATPIIPHSKNSSGSSFSFWSWLCCKRRFSASGYNINEEDYPDEHERVRRGSNSSTETAPGGIPTLPLQEDVASIKRMGYEPL